MVGYYTIEIRVDGRPRKGRWQLRQGGKLFVTCPWGRDTVEIGCAEPASAAQQALAQIVAQHEKARLAELQRQEREMAKFRRPKRKPKAQNDKSPDPS